MSPPAAAAATDLLLKVTPPRVPRDALARAALSGSQRALGEQPVVLVQAPAGFGKTLLLAQWRREHLSRGAAVAWLLAQPEDDPARFVQALALAVRVGAGRPTFGHALLQAGGPTGLEGVTTWLAEVAQGALNLVLVVDEADRLPPATREALAYLLRNAPPNLRCIVAARSDCQLELEDLVAYGQCVVIGTAQLRFTLDETLQLVRNRFGQAMDPDAAARLHEMAEGWPLGLQLALSVAGPGARPELPQPGLHGGALRSQLLDYLLGNLDPADLDFLARISVADPLHPGLCEVLVPGAGSRTRLERLLRDTPVFVASEQSDWVRLHSLAREALRERLQAAAPDDVRALHARAAEWLARQGLLDAAAGHALASGQEQLAYELAERSLYELMVAQGRQTAVLEWVRQLPPGELERRPRLLLAAAWSLAISERHEEAGRLVARLLEQPDADEGLRWECALILGGAAMFADDPDRFVALHEPWPEAPPRADTRLRQIHANRLAMRALLQGEPALARLRQQQGPRSEGTSSEHLNRWGDLIISLSYLWEGQVKLAEQLLRPALAGMDGNLGRRAPLACDLAALLAAALWERDQPEEAQALLANRLDVLERCGLADCVMLGYRALARMAVASDNEPRALELLGALDAVGIARRLPRLRIASLSEQVRVHARRYRSETCRDLCRQLDALLAEPGLPQGPLWRRTVDGMRRLAQAYAAISAQDWRGAVQPLAEAEALALQSRQGRVRIEALGLRAWVLDRCGEKAQPLVREAMGLAEACGLQRVFSDAHPGLADWLRNSSAAAPVRASSPAAPPPARSAIQPRATASMVLTPKEREVLELLARSLSNKEIGLAMQVGEETIKWHMKNLFAKLDAGTRKQVVSRARILGLLADTATP
ncbi:helix-turn-helix transcriptional regulator [Ramlibacter cellulosilyticus]|uniref:helix-turn-helix transcriptional regulator n=1 Tax=Ramlibacter cellulosilyticus TaxID=2764187 RepID=UPI0033901BFC